MLRQSDTIREGSKTFWSVGDLESFPWEPQDQLNFPLVIKPGIL